MDRRESLKALLVGSVAAGATGMAVTGCKNPIAEQQEDAVDLGGGYGRTPSEMAWDENINATTYFSDHEMETIAVLCDIILPATETAGSAIDAGVPEFVEFIVKDLPSHQLPIRGGIGWLDIEANGRFNNHFASCSNTQQISIVDDIAYPDPDREKPDMAPGIKFFDKMRDLTLTGYYTTKMGFDDLGYKGNVPNIWDGVPPEVLANHDVDYDPAWIAKCVDQSQREVIAEWDEDGNLLT